MIDRGDNTCLQYGSCFYKIIMILLVPFSVIIIHYCYCCFPCIDVHIFLTFFADLLTLSPAPVVLVEMYFLHTHFSLFKRTLSYLCHLIFMFL